MKKIEALALMEEELEEEYPDAVLYYFPQNPDGSSGVLHKDLDWSIITEFLVAKGWRKR